MKIIYIANHGGDGNDDEGAIAFALTQLGHDVVCIRESRASTAVGMTGDLVLIHKLLNHAILSRIKIPKVFWYFDLVNFPDPTLSSRNTSRIQWMKATIPLVNLGFCTDGDWVNQDRTGKLVCLRQGADERKIGKGVSPSGSSGVLLTGISAGGGRGRIDFVQHMTETYGPQFTHVVRGTHGERLKTELAAHAIAVAPNSPVTDNYWSNRVYLTLGFAGFLLHPYCKTLAEQYEDGKEIVFYKDLPHLDRLISEYLPDAMTQQRLDIAAAGYERTAKFHLYRHRCIDLLRTVQERLNISVAGSPSKAPVTQPIFDPSYWKERLNKATEIHRSVFICTMDQWRKINQDHSGKLAKAIGHADSILDAGCGYGRLLDLLPAAWKGNYLGLDISPDFIAKAKLDHPGRKFEVADLRDLSKLADHTFDWGVLISIRPMVIRNAGEAEWLKMDAELRRVCKQLLFLEYGELDS